MQVNIAKYEAIMRWIVRLILALAALIAAIAKLI
jgi:hypothetical protein